MKEHPHDNFVPKIHYNVFRKCTPEWHLQPHFVTGYDMTYLVEGRACYTIDQKPYDIKQGDMLWLNEGSEKKAITYKDNLMHCYSINFSAMNPALKISPPPFLTVNNIGIRQDLLDMFRELTISWSRQQNGYILKTRALHMMILHRISEIIIDNIDSSTGDYRINKAINIIAIHYSEKLTVKELASQVKLDEVYFGYLFKKETGITVRQYITQIRIRHAENMLQRGNLKIYQVAEYCGFSDVVHFYKSFKDVRGFPPSRCLPKKH